MAKEGAFVALAARRINKLKEVQASLPFQSKDHPWFPSRKEEKIPTSICIQTDVTSREAVKSLISKTTETFGRHPDILINVAGVMYFTLMKNLHER
jgi:NADP-dependent 3-hydroxy acid dehydrogenase YdfG